MAIAARPDTVGQGKLLRLLRDEGPRSRAELGELAGMARSKLEAELVRLKQVGLVQEGGKAASRGGRRSTLVELSSFLHFGGIDLGATSIGVAVMNAELQIEAHVEEPMEVRRGPEAVLGRVGELIEKLARDQGVQLTGVGVGVPGPVRFRDGMPVSPPIMPGWHEYPVRDILARRFGCPVLVDNDVNVMAVGEHWGGVAKSVDNYLFVKIGTGIGCGIMIRGQVYRGIDGCAGDIGHINVDPDGPVCACGNSGCLEAMFGGAALVRDALAAARSGASPPLAERLARKQAITPEDVGQCAAEGDPVAIGLIRDGGRRVGLVLAGLVSFFNPSMIVIGGGLAGLGHLLLAEIRGVVYRRSLPLATGNLPIVLSELGPSAGAVGAAVMISDHVFSIP
ncbi:MAG TPA: ROK family transcriptional regulator [Actinomycetota bacterium]|jgi:glucokinase-like ROK family protein|nr:ROK family transcriptional regulator [Actinomycetota bacterium]